MIGYGIGPNILEYDEFKKIKSEGRHYCKWWDSSMAPFGHGNAYCFEAKCGCLYSSQEIFGKNSKFCPGCGLQATTCKKDTL